MNLLSPRPIVLDIQHELSVCGVSIELGNKDEQRYNMYHRMNTCGQPVTKRVVVENQGSRTVFYGCASLAQMLVQDHDANNVQVAEYKAAY